MRYVKFLYERYECFISTKTLKFIKAFYYNDQRYLIWFETSISNIVGHSWISDSSAGPAEAVRKWCAKNERNSQNPTAEGFLFLYFKKSYFGRKKEVRRKPVLPQSFRRPCSGVQQVRGCVFEYSSIINSVYNTCLSQILVRVKVNSPFL